ncbi:leucine-rich repeat-containing protein 46 isoform X2 [Phacochoerus africanus]|uniref:leucine-rich repeat-containing protein 46 isoform X2 n=1 Tax=Phacochoerus africanus TaxID=41426 RepID=UPI001FDACB6A|nr:leucine-rich repeat-containing protein 46 isoform X2 [Phacochoerus africanus]
MPGAKLVQSPEEGGVCITEALITKRNLTFPEDEDLSEKMFHTLAELQTVRLDREGITTIRNLEGLQNLHSLYLQGNKIQRIENLACVPSLRKLVTEALPLLLDLDGQPVSERWTSDEEDEASSDEDKEFPELKGPFCSERGFLKELDQEMSRHQERRQQAALLEHLLRVETQPALTALPLLPGAPMAGDSSPSVPPSQGKVTSPEPASSPQASSVTKKPCPLASRSQQSTGKGATGAIASTTSKASLPGAPRTTKAVTKRIKK